MAPDRVLFTAEESANIEGASAKMFSFLIRSLTGVSVERSYAIIESLKGRRITVADVRAAAEGQ